jgi:uncharacterized protein (TIGR02266 family)
MDERQFGGQRRGKRVTVNREFESVEQFVREYVTNISSNGAFIVTNEPLPKGTRVQLKFTVVMDKIEIVEGQGEVVRVVMPGEGAQPGMGVVFTKLTAASKDLIVKMVTRTPKRKPVILG